MNNYLEKLQQQHRRLNRIIDNCKAAGRQHEMQQLKRVRLRIKDKIAAVTAQLQPARS
ncbi:YdcH family protein [Parasphingorhabdus sp.]|uniref:YdcH family protein n=1 Tax=Parasphingorhabdus sp. TaxID=2709688 RepID=UPI003265F417